MGALIVGLIKIVWAATPYIAMAAGAMAIQHRQAEKAQSESQKIEKAVAEEQATAAARARAVQNAPLTAKQMEKVVKQRELKSLVDTYIEQEKNPQVYTLPTAQPSDPVTRANQYIHKILTGAA